MSDSKEVLAPILPAGFFFRVTESKDQWGDKALKVDLREKVWFFSISAYSKKVRYYLTPLHVREAMDELKNRLDRDVRVDSILGEYPPKRVIGG